MSLNSGHYFSYVRSPANPEQWFCCNDSHVSAASPRDVQNQRAYMVRVCVCACVCVCVCVERDEGRR